jgi:predicted nucleic acid-binding protein
VNEVAAFDGRPFVVDTSAWAREPRRHVADDWSQAMLAGQLWITPVVKLELLYSTRDQAEFGQLERRLDSMREAPLDRSTVRAAVTALRELAATGPLHHRLPITDALIAAAAAERGVGVLHYDEHFDRLAAVLGFESRWIVARGEA